MKWYSRSRSVPATPRGLPAEAAIASSPGCMSMVHLIFAPGAGCVGRPPASSHDPDHLRRHAAAIVSSSHHLNSAPPSSHAKGGGLEAPRNSLEELEGGELRDIQIGVQVEPAFDALAGRRSTGSRATAPPSEAETPRTPSLVARLMGIDGLPDSPSPGLLTKNNTNPKAAVAAAAKEKKKRVIPESMNRQPLRGLSCNIGAGEARSLPDTPRASASSARSAASASGWDVVDRPRLSLQLLRDSVLDRAAQYMSVPTSPTSASKKKSKDRAHRRRDAKEHAREIVRQAKETVTNRNRYAGGGGPKRPPSSTNSSDDKENAIPFAVLVEDKKMVVHVQATAASIKPTTPSTAPLAAAKAQGDQQHPHAPRLPPPPLRAKPSRPPPPPPPPDHPAPARAAPLSPQAVKCKRPPDGCERFATRIKKPGAGAGAGTATIQQAAPAASPSPGAAAAASTCSHPRVDQYHHRKSHPAVATTSSSPLEDNPEYGYLRSVLERGGFMRATPPAPSTHRPFKAHSASSPVDPIVFHLLELSLPTDGDSPRLGPLRHRWNRKLLFHLTQEILADLLHDGATSGSATAAAGPSLALHGPALLGKVWSRVKAFPAADCRVVGDIDELVAHDLRTLAVRGLARHPAVAEEAGDVAEDVAEWVLDALLRESLPLVAVAGTCTEVAVGVTPGDVA